MKGHCLCGAVTLTFPDARMVGVCHCNMCRRWSGGPLLALAIEGALTVDGQEHATIYASSDWAERCFCSKCGSHLYYHVKGLNHYSVPAGLIQEDKQFELSRQIFIDEKPDYYALANETPKLTGAEIFAQYASGT